MIDDATQKNLTEHLEAFFERRKGIVCEVESVIVPDPVAMLGVESPVMDQIKPSGAAKSTSEFVPGVRFQLLLHGERNNERACSGEGKRNPCK